MHNKNIIFSKLSLTALLLQLLLCEMASKISKLIGQYDYHKLVSSITTPINFVYVTVATDLLKYLISNVNAIFSSKV